MELTTGGVSSLYYFQRNLQGDVVAIYDTNGALKAKYLYDAWGNCTISGETTIYDVANANPIRYRSYYYDDDTGLYYCNARYYSPKWRRFISPDDTAYLDPETVNGLNLYCYCNNDPVNYCDPSGHFAITSWLIAMGVGFGIGFAVGGVANVVGRGISDLVKHVKVSHRIDAIASEANTIANMSAKQKSLAIWKMIVMENFSRNAYKDWTYEQIFNLLMTEATNVSAIYATNNLMRYIIYSAIVSSTMSGWY